MSFSGDNEQELLFKVHRKKNDQGKWCPAIEDVNSHDINPLWVAGTLYAIFSRYMDSVEESKQTEFENSVLYFFNYLMEDGAEFLDRIPNPEDDSKEF